MTLPLTGEINLSMVADFLGRPGTPISLNDQDVRELAGIFDPNVEITMDDLRGAAAENR